MVVYQVLVPLEDEVVFPVLVEVVAELVVLVVQVVLV
jgi:hypothetical protein